MVFLMKRSSFLLLVVLTILTRTSAAEEAAEIAASIPGATSTPRWDISDAPFDVSDYLRLPPKEQNGAALYLDAIAEFDDDTAMCLPESVREARRKQARERYDRHYVVMMKREKAPDAVTDEEVAAIASLYAEGFRKLRVAQQRPACVIETGLSFSAVLPHAQGARQIARIVDLKSVHDIRHGRLDTVINDIDVALRLAGDLRHRGYLINHLVAIAIESIVMQTAVTELLGADGLTVEQCDRLLTVLRRNQPNYNDEYRQAIRMEYISCRSFLHDVQHRVGDFKPDESAENESKAFADRFTGFLGQDSEEIRRLASQLAEFTDQDYQKEIDWLDLAFFRIEQAFDLPFEQRLSRLQAISAGVEKNTQIMRFVVPAFLPAVRAFVRGDARHAGMRCLTAVRRWQLMHPDSAEDSLKRIMLSSGANRVPADAYGGDPIRLTWIDGRPVVYSLGPDLKDGKAAVKWEYREPVGDFVFTLPKSTSK